MHGLVIKNTGSWYTVLTDDGQLLDCKVKGNFRIKGIRSTNPVAVGDRVTVGEGNWITEIEDRRNYIIRKSINLSKQSHIIAANVDQAFLVVTVVNPQTSTTFIDRFLASAEAYRVPVVLVFNKTDLLDEDMLRYQEAMVNLYKTVGYDCYQVSAENGDGNGKIELSGVTDIEHVSNAPKIVKASEYYAHPTWTGEANEVSVAYRRLVSSVSRASLRWHCGCEV